MMNEMTGISLCHSIGIIIGTDARFRVWLIWMHRLPVTMHWRRPALAQQSFGAAAYAHCDVAHGLNPQRVAAAPARSK